MINAGGTGSTTVTVENSSVAGSLSLNGGTGNEAISFIGLKDSIAHDVVLSGGAGDNEISSAASFLTIGGKLAQTGGTGRDTLSILQGTVKVGGNLEFTGGSNVSTVQLTPAQLTIGGNVSLAGDGTFNVSPVGTLRVAKSFIVNGGFESDGRYVGDGSVAAMLGSIAIDTEIDSRSDIVRIAPVALLQVAGSVVVNQTSGNSTNTILADVVKIGGALTLNLDTTNDNQTDTASISANTSLAVKGDLTISSAENELDASVTSQGTLTIGGKLLLQSLAPVSLVNKFTISAVTAKIGHDLTLTAIDGDYSAILSGGDFSIGGDLHAEDQAGGGQGFAGRPPFADGEEDSSRGLPRWHVFGPYRHRRRAECGQRPLPFE